MKNKITHTDFVLYALVKHGRTHQQKDISIQNGIWDSKPALILHHRFEGKIESQPITEKQAKQIIEISLNG